MKRKLFAGELSKIFDMQCEYTKQVLMKSNNQLEKLLSDVNEIY